MNVLKIWIEKYGEEKANEMWAERNRKLGKTKRANNAKMTKEQRAKMYGRSGEQSGMFGKNVESIWAEEHGAEKAHEMWLEHSKKISETSKGVVNIGDKNGMKSPEARAKASATRKELFKDPEFMQRHIDMTKKAWADGKMDGVQVGRCKWYDCILKDGTTVKAQGTWERAYIQHLDENDVKFKCHRGRIPYVIDGEEHSYYPDFYLIDEDTYVDVKNAYHWSLQEDKFKAIRKSNPDLKLRILFKEDLENMGVILNEK